MDRKPAALLLNVQQCDVDRTDWVGLASVVFAGLVVASHVGMLPISVSSIQADLGASLFQLGLLGGSMSVIAMMFAGVLGVVSDRFGYRNCFLYGLAVLAIGAVIGSASSSLALLIFSRMIEGAGLIVSVVAAPGLVLSLSSFQGRRLALSIWSIYLSVGTALVMLLGPLILAGTDWRSLWLCTALLTSIAAALVMFSTKNSISNRSALLSPLRVLFDVLNAKGVMLIAAISLAYVFQLLAVMLWLPTFLSSQIGYSHTDASLTTAIFMLVNGAGNLSAGWVMHKGAPRWAIMVGSAAIMGGGALLIFSPGLSEQGRLVCLFTFSFVGGLLPPVFLASAEVNSPSLAHLGTANGIIVQGSHCGQVIGPPLIAYGVTVNDGSWASASYILVGASMLVFMLAILLGRVER